MAKLYSLMMIMAFLGGFGLTACTGNEADTSSLDLTPGPVATQVETPAEFAGMTNPFSADSMAASEGKTIYQTNCASCHGESARGDGPAATSLDPKPPDLAEKVSTLTDGYLYWRISEGGMMEPFHSAMPAWKTILSEEQIWQLVTYLQELGG